MTRTPTKDRTAARLAAPLCLLLACALAAPAQPAAGQAPQSAAAQAAQPVRLNVIVVDKAGRSVADVRREDVRVSEDGAQQAVTRVALEELPATYALLVDNSASLRRSLDTIIRTASAIVLGGKPGDEAALIRFVDAEKIETLEDFTGDKETLVQAVEGMFVEGGYTAVIDAVHYAVKKVAARGAGGERRRRAVVLITDGEDRNSRLKSEELTKLLRQEDVQVFVVALVHLLSDEGGFTHKSSRAKAADLMTTVAEESGGRAFFPKDTAGLKTAVEEITLNLRSQYVVEYGTANAARDGKFRRVQVKVADAAGGGGGRKAVTRTGYFTAGGGAQSPPEDK